VLTDFTCEHDGATISLKAGRDQVPDGHGLHRRFPARNERGQAASRFRSTMRAVPAVPAAKCCAGVVPVWSRERWHEWQRLLVASLGPR
jgi:hypothetical protein